jgi:hypothetical protein
MDILRCTYGPLKDENWSRIGKLAGDKNLDHRFWGTADLLKYQHEGWEILLDIFVKYRGSEGETIPYTRVQVPFSNPQGLGFKIYRESILSSVGKLFKMQDIEIGDAAFDSKFIIKGNDEGKIKLLLDDAVLKNLIHQQPDILFEVQFEKVFKFKKVCMLYFQCEGMFRSMSQLEALFKMFAVTLTRMEQLELTSRNVPSEELKQISTDTDAPENTKPDKTGINLDELRQGVKELKSNSKKDDLQ